MKEEKKEEKKEIIILDPGIDMDGILGPDWICCNGPIMPVR